MEKNLKEQKIACVPQIFAWTPPASFLIRLPKIAMSLENSILKEKDVKQNVKILI